MYTDFSPNSPSGFVDCDEIEPGLYLGDLNSASNEKACQERKITHILTAFYFAIPLPNHIKTLFLEVCDSEDEDLLSYFDQTYEFIKEAQEKGCCLVHCFAGISRSATLVMAYLMKKYSITYPEARGQVKNKRHHIRPNSGFVSQLELYESMNCSLDRNNLRYRIFLLEHLSKGDILGKKLAAVETYASESLIRISGDKFKCRKCREYLFSEQNLLPHQAERNFTWTELSDDDTVPNCDSTFCIDILPWVCDAFISPSGKILCPKCSAKLGSFNWTGHVCACGASLEPSFRITPSNVDRENAH